MKRFKRKSFTVVGLLLLLAGTLLLSGCYRYGYGYNPYNRYNRYSGNSYYYGNDPYYGYNRYHDNNQYYSGAAYYNQLPTAVSLCPRCNSSNIIPIIYGNPTPEQVKQEQAGSIILGGNAYGPNAPYWYCKSCGTYF